MRWRRSFRNWGGLVTKNRADIGAFKTNTCGYCADIPYMHDGSLKTLWDVVDHYNKGGVANPFLDGGIKSDPADGK